jgi:hypothetical protein
VLRERNAERGIPNIKRPMPLLVNSDSSLGYPSSGQISDDFGTGTGHYSFTPTVALTNYHYYNVSASSTNWIARINGTPQFTNAPNTVYYPGAPYNQAALGASGSFTGNISEVMIFDRVPSPGERTTVQNYLNGKYGL